MTFDSVQNRAAGVGLPIEERWRLQREEKPQLVREWLPIAQFPTQSEDYFGCFLIRTEDLTAKRFDLMRSHTMFSE